MLKDTPIRGSDQRRKYVRAVVVCAAAWALLLARNTSPQFPDTTSVHAITADAHHDQRPRFDNSGTTCCSMNAAFVLSPPAEMHSHLTLATVLLFSFPTKGAHYNRPPPIL
jgi:hypothetical protein